MAPSSAKDAAVAGPSEGCACGGEGGGGSGPLGPHLRSSLMGPSRHAWRPDQAEYCTEEEGGERELGLKEEERNGDCCGDEKRVGLSLRRYMFIFFLTS